MAIGSETAGRFAATLSWAAGALLLLAAAPASAQEYRTGLPTVLEKREPAPGTEAPLDAPAIRDAFARAYAGEGRPRLAVYWNRRFTDRLSQWVEVGYLSLARELELTGAIDGRRGRERMPLLAREDREVEVTRNAGPTPEDADLRPLAAAEFAAGFNAPLLATGAQIVDRATIMRVTDSNMRRNGERRRRGSDAQLVETEALKSFADYIFEVTALADRAAELNAAFRVQVKRIPDGLIVAHRVVRGPDPEIGDGDRRANAWETDGQGYLRKPRRASVRAADLGRHVALRTMDALAEHWQR